MSSWNSVVGLQLLMSVSNPFMKTKTIVLLLFALIILPRLNAQKVFKEGYVLLSESDTVFGKIEDRNYNYNSLNCNFYAADSNSLITYTPQDIFGYRFDNGKFYISKTFELDGKDTTLFMEYLINAELDFYFVQTKGLDNRYFVSTDSTPLKELKYSKHIVTIDGQLVEKESKAYAHLLSYLTGQKAEFEEDIQNINQPTHKKLIRFGEEYNKAVCPGGICIVYEKQVKIKMLLEVSAGVKLVALHASDYENPVGSFFGVSFLFNNPRFSERGYFGIGFIKESDLELITEKNTTYHNFMIPVSYGYISPAKGLSPCFSVGLNIRSVEKMVINSLTFTPGLKYDVGNIFVKLYAEFEMASILIIPVGYYSTNFGMSINFKLNNHYNSN
ncbi:MAG: hypothetical protein Q8O72_17930 [Bacteroidales bacterium]|nr:hypothetical protein [Bacteroidales bacterium]